MSPFKILKEFMPGSFLESLKILLLALFIGLLWLFSDFVFAFFVSIFVIFVFYKFDSAIIGKAALLCLVGIPVLLYLKRDEAAEQLAVFTFFLLSITVILQIIELRRDSQDELEDELDELDEDYDENMDDEDYEDTSDEKIDEYEESEVMDLETSLPSAPKDNFVIPENILPEEPIVIVHEPDLTKPELIQVEKPGEKTIVRMPIEILKPKKKRTKKIVSKPVKDKKTKVAKVLKITKVKKTTKKVVVKAKRPKKS